MTAISPHTSIFQVPYQGPLMEDEIAAFAASAGVSADRTAPTADELMFFLRAPSTAAEEPFFQTPSAEKTGQVALQLTIPKPSSDGKNRPFACTQCNYAATTKSLLTRHLRIHTGERPYACTQCDFSTAQKGNLTSHLRTHTGERPYACTQCDFAATKKTNLTRHLRTHIGQEA